MTAPNPTARRLRAARRLLAAAPDLAARRNRPAALAARALVSRGGAPRPVS